MVDVVVVHRHRHFGALLRRLFENLHRSVEVFAPPPGSTVAESLLALLNDADPRVVVYDLVPPYEYEYAVLLALQGHAGGPERQFILTSADPDALSAVVGEVAVLPLRSDRRLPVVIDMGDMAAVGIAVRDALVTDPGMPAVPDEPSE